MAFKTLDADQDGELSEINMIPLIDVMLVLLIVFMITVPVMQHSVNIQLPQASSTPAPKPEEAVRLGVEADGAYLWNGSPVTDEELTTRLQALAATNAETPLHLLADKAVPYERVALLLAAAQQAGLARVGFVTEPAAPR
ncbi:MAG: biopolymer transporter ExbD [Serpentinimonas sp.]|jgi:biopolymer transport protein ExbD|nr:biopolymer transporter ExbD [Serpentinimonas sp.]